jgi:hypothetical protein
MKLSNLAAVLTLVLTVLAQAVCISCARPTPAQEASAVKTAIDAGRAACIIAQAKSVDLTSAQKVWCAK